MNIFQSFTQGNPILMAVFLLLIGMSCASWYVIFRKIIVLKTEYTLLATFHKQYLHKPELLILSLQTTHKGCINNIITEANILKPLLHNLDLPEQREIISMHLAQVLDLIKIRLDGGLTLLASVSNSAPFIGLFGTVLGIYGALLEVSAKGSAGLNVVAGPMGEALTATAVGLFAAIPAALAYNIFLRYNRLIVQDLRHISEQFSIYLPKFLMK
jgi:biopolymer transport protein ExbB